jgi:predicted Zn-dependent protease with MMP-like domain
MQEEWGQWIEDGLAELKSELRVRIDNVAILLEDEPSDAVRRVYSR